ncbi:MULTISPECIES: hypothetical protein [unclassified Streptomyces]|uniref:hypothetical protein n=1 Tax=unclassified Streptomyces TaxID=2593676 RepID=UPI0023656D79|nr:MULTISPECIES: hypothetical protein [unclassified Streptomyces]MDF3145534.1 hypothetical protein [Streptomyces sp. T21Q-yed]WDF40264.1 hypothetical protein PBV52_27510 [Streptomyces sp. T12]
MSITQHHLLDTYRAHRLGEPAPPAPGVNDWQVVREWRDHREFRAALADRPAHGRIRRALGRWLHPRSRSTC